MKEKARILKVGTVDTSGPEPVFHGWVWDCEGSTEPVFELDGAGNLITVAGWTIEELIRLAGSGDTET